MAGTGNNGTGRRLRWAREWFAPSIVLDRSFPASVRIVELNYPSQFKRSGGI